MMDINESRNRTVSKPLRYAKFSWRARKNNEYLEMFTSGKEDLGVGGGYPFGDHLFSLQAPLYC